MTMTNNPIGVFFSGAGGVGKTVAITELIKLIEQQGTCYFMPSVSRSFFAKNGMSSEEVGLLKSEEDRYDFQTRMLKHYCSELKDAYGEAAARNVDFFLADRAPFDHLGWLIYNAPNLLTVDKYHELFAIAGAALHELQAQIHLFSMPFPVSWTTDSSGKDHFRFNPFGKNLLIHSTVYELCRRYCVGNDLVHTGTHVVHYDMPDTTIEGRALYVYKTLQVAKAYQDFQERDKDPLTYKIVAVDAAGNEVPYGTSPST